MMLKDENDTKKDVLELVGAAFVAAFSTFSAAFF
jgi:hypothetical protein